MQTHFLISNNSYAWRVLACDSNLRIGHTFHFWGIGGLKPKHMSVFAGLISLPVLADERNTSTRSSGRRSWNITSHESGFGNYAANAAIPREPGPLYHGVWQHGPTLSCWVSEKSPTSPGNPRREPLLDLRIPNGGKSEAL